MSRVFTSATARTWLVAVVVVVFAVVGAVLVFASQGPAPQRRTFQLQVTGSHMSPDQLQAYQGDTLAIAVVADRAEEIHLHGYDKHFFATPGQPVTLTFPGDRTGSFVLEVEATSTPLGTLQVQPRGGLLGLGKPPDQSSTTVVKNQFAGITRIATTKSYNLSLEVGPLQPMYTPAQVSTQAPATSIAALAVTPAAVFVGTAGGLYASPGLDGPLTPVAFPGGAVRAIAVDPRDARSIWVASAGGPVRSADGGQTWAPVAAGLARPGRSAAIAVLDGEVFVSDTTGVFRWSSAGGSWVRTSGQPSVTDLAAGAGRLYASSSADDDVQVLAAGRWTDLGAPAPVHHHNGHLHGGAGPVTTVDGRLYAAGRAGHRRVGGLVEPAPAPRRHRQPAAGRVRAPLVGAGGGPGRLT